MKRKGYISWYFKKHVGLQLKNNSTILGTEDAILYAAAFDANGMVSELLFNEQDAIIPDELKHWVCWSKDFGIF